MSVGTPHQPRPCIGSIFILKLAVLFSCNAWCQDSALSQRLRERIDLATRDGQPPGDLVAFYAERQFAAAWSVPARRAMLAAALAALQDDGLDPHDYPIGTGSAGTEAESSLDLEVDRELLATEAYLRALHHLRLGKVDSAIMDVRGKVPRPLNFQTSASIVADAHAVDDVSTQFEHARPQHPAYGHLRDALRRLRRLQAEGGWPFIPNGSILKVGAVDARVPLLRERLIASGYLQREDSADANFDSLLDAAVREFQTEQYLEADGKVGPATLAVLNQPVRTRVDQLRANLERARWFLHDLPNDFVLVDIAGFKVLHHREGLPDWRARAQVGQPYRSTPSFRSEITAITFNPTWTVPPTILRNDILPRVRATTEYLTRNRIRVFDASGREVAPGTVDWSRPSGFTLRQDASSENSLGRVVIQFPNPYDVFMHDTPHAELFARQQRAFSSGCIRIERPLELVERLLADTPDWDHDAIADAVAEGSTRTVSLASPVVVILAYWSVDTHNGERLAFKPDLYGQDARILQALDAPIALSENLDAPFRAPTY